MNAKTTTLAEAVRIEIDDSNGDVYVVFKVIDSKFKQTVKTEWTKDILFEVINKKLIKFED